jgi:hypothetical protein
VDGAEKEDPQALRKSVSGDRPNKKIRSFVYSTLDNLSMCLKKVADKAETHCPKTPIRLSWLRVSFFIFVA